MKRTTLVVALLAAMTAASGAHAAGANEALCRGEYAIMLMTDAECRQYVRQVEALRAEGETRPLQRVMQEHAELLRERAAACPCIGGQPTEAPRQQVALIDPGC